MTITNLMFDVKNNDYLVWQGQIVMSRSEEPYFRQLFACLSKKLHPKRILEVGFGLGISAGLIQEYLCPTEHHIVEIDKGIYTDLQNFAIGRPNIVPHLGDWRSIPFSSPFDFVFYDPFDYSSASNEVITESDALRQLVGATGVVCHPHFGDGPPRNIEGFRTVILDRLSVPVIKMADGSCCEHAAVILCFPN